MIIINWQSERSHSQVLKIEIHDNYVCLVRANHTEHHATKVIAMAMTSDRQMQCNKRRRNVEKTRWCAKEEASFSLLHHVDVTNIIISSSTNSPNAGLEPLAHVTTSTASEWSCTYHIIANLNFHDLTVAPDCGSAHCACSTSYACKRSCTCISSYPDFFPLLSFGSPFPFWLLSSLISFSLMHRFATGF